MKTPLIVRAFYCHLRAWKHQKNLTLRAHGTFTRICPAREITIDNSPAFIIYENTAAGISIAASPNDINHVFLTEP